jgi:exodeoxyribonuclease-3
MTPYRDWRPNEGHVAAADRANALYKAGERPQWPVNAAPSHQMVGSRGPLPVKLATWNVNSLAVRLPQLLDWLAANPVDAMVLQETKLTDDKFPRDAIEAAGWRVVFYGQKTYNGVALLARDDPADVLRNIVGFADEQARVIAGCVGPIRVVGGYFPNGQAPGTDKFAYKLAWMKAMRDWLADELKKYPQLVLMGDFNVAPEDRDVHDPVAWAGQIHCTDEERAAFRALLDVGLHDAFRLFEQPPKSWSWWDYRMLAFRKNQGLRIDHILVSDALKGRVTACTIDKEPRRNERPSDHAPVIVTLAD